MSVWFAKPETKDNIYGWNSSTLVEPDRGLTHSLYLSNWNYLDTMEDKKLAQSGPLRIFVFDSTRLRSHLFFRYLSTHPDLAPVYHSFLMAGMFGPEHLSQHLQHSSMREKEIREDLQPFRGTETYEENQRDLVSAVSEAERRGKIVFANEHWFNVFCVDVVLDLIRDTTTELGRNPTHIADDLFISLTTYPAPCLGCPLDLSICLEVYQAASRRTRTFH